MDKFREGEDNPFDAPIPGQGLTDEPGNYPWEHPPQFTDPDEAAEFVWDRLHRPEFMEQVIAMLDAGIPIEAIARVILFGGFTEGKWSPDVAFIIAEPVMKMIAAVGIHGGVKKFRMSMQDLTNNKQMKAIMSVKSRNEELEKAAKSLGEDIKKIPQQKGLMAQPKPKEEEIS